MTSKRDGAGLANKRVSDGNISFSLDPEQQLRLLQSSYRTIETNKDDFEVYVAKYQGDTFSEFKASRSIFGLPLIPPWSIYTRSWMMLICLLDMFYTAIIFPYTEAWKTHDFNMLSFEIAIASVFLLDVAINLSTPYVLRYKNDQLLLYKGRDIFWMYLTRSTMIIDCISSVTFFVVTLAMLLPEIDENSSALSLLRLLRLLRYWYIFNLMQTLILGSWVYGYAGNLQASGFLSLSTVYLLAIGYCTVVIVNTLGCFWWILGTAVSSRNYEDGTAWPFHAGGLGSIVGYPAWRQYVSSIYYIFTTLTTTGYGDIVPQNTWEQIGAMIIMACAALLFAFLVGTFVSSLMSSSPSAKRASTFKAKMESVDAFITMNSIPRKLHIKVFRYYADVWLRNQEEAAMWASMEDLGPSIRAELFCHLVSPYIQRIDPFVNLSMDTILQLCGLLEAVPLPPHMDLCVQGDHATCIWILHEGCLTQFKCGRPSGKTIWAPGVVGVVALKGLSQSTEADWGEPGRNNHAYHEDGPHTQQQALPDGHALIYPCTLRTIGSCTLFRLTIPRLEAVLEGLSAYEQSDFKKQLLDLLVMDREVGQDSRVAVVQHASDRTSFSHNGGFSNSRKSSKVGKNSKSVAGDVGKSFQTFSTTRLEGKNDVELRMTKGTENIDAIPQVDTHKDDAELMNTGMEVIGDTINTTAQPQFTDVV